MKQHVYSLAPNTTLGLLDELATLQTDNHAETKEWIAEREKESFKLIDILEGTVGIDKDVVTIYTVLMYRR